MANQTLMPTESGFGSPYVDSLVIGYKWSGTPISYSFGDGLMPGYSPSPTYTGHAWNLATQDAFRSAFQLYQNVCNINFHEVTYDSVNLSDMVLFQVGNAFWGGTPVTGEFEYPNGAYPSIFGYFNYEKPIWTNQNRGGESYAVIIHEIGHALGLSHPFNGGHLSEGFQFPGVTFNSLNSLGDYEMNQGIWTVMSYNHGWNNQPIGGSNYGWQSAPMALDIAALQTIYGANTSYKTGNDVYLLPQNNDSGTGWTCLWDAGGNDTISNQDSSLDCVINLNSATLSGEHAGGDVSWNHGISGGYTIANSVIIENALGGNGNDKIIGNASDNTLTGNGGNDSLIGGDGTDTAIFTGQRSNYLVSYDHVLDQYKIVDRSGRDGTDFVSEIEYFKFSDITLAASNLMISIDSEATGTLTVNGSYLTNEGTWTPASIFAGATAIAQLQSIVDSDSSTVNTNYLWEAFHNNAWTLIPGGNTNTLSIPADEVGTQIRVIVTTTDALGGTTDFVSGTYTIAAATNVPVASYEVPSTSIQSVGLLPDGQQMLIKIGDVTKLVNKGDSISFSDQIYTTDELVTHITPIPIFQSSGGTGGFTLPDRYTGPASLGLKYQLIETANNAIVTGSADNDFIKVASTHSVGKAVNGGGGTDVIDGGVGSTFITGGNGHIGDTFFLDGRASGISWSTITDFHFNSDQATIWGFVPGVSRIADEVAP